MKDLEALMVDILKLLASIILPVLVVAFVACTAGVIIGFPIYLVTGNQVLAVNTGGCIAFIVFIGGLMFAGSDWGSV